MATTAKRVTPDYPSACAICWHPFAREDQAIELVPDPNKVIVMQYVCDECARALAELMKIMAEPGEQGDAPCEPTVPTEQPPAHARRRKPPP